MFNKFYITVDGGKGTKKLRKQMAKWFDILNTKLDAVMTKQEQLDGLIQRLMGSSAGIASDLRTLATQINEGTVTPESLTRLEQIAKTFEDLDAQNTAEGSGTGEPGAGEDTGNGADGDNGAGAGEQQP